MGRDDPRLSHGEPAGPSLITRIAIGLASPFEMSSGFSLSRARGFAGCGVSSIRIGARPSPRFRCDFPEHKRHGSVLVRIGNGPVLGLAVAGG